MSWTEVDESMRDVVQSLLARTHSEQEQHHGTFRFTRDADYASIAEIIIPTDGT